MDSQAFLQERIEKLGGEIRVLRLMTDQTFTQSMEGTLSTEQREFVQESLTSLYSMKDTLHEQRGELLEKLLSTLTPGPSTSGGAGLQDPREAIPGATVTVFAGHPEKATHRCTAPLYRRRGEGALQTAAGQPGGRLLVQNADDLVDPPRAAGRVLPTMQIEEAKKLRKGAPPATLLGKDQYGLSIEVFPCGYIVEVEPFQVASFSQWRYIWDDVKRATYEWIEVLAGATKKLQRRGWLAG